MADVDRLEVKVEAQATRANNALETLVGKLERISSALKGISPASLSGFATGIDNISKASAGLSNIKTTDFTRLSKNIEKIASIDTQKIRGAAISMTTLGKSMNNLGSVSKNSMQVAQVAKDISKLGGANVQKAVTNLPLLTKELRNFMTEMSKAPMVSENTIRMTNALANLASQGSKVGSATKGLRNSFSSYGGYARSARTSTWSLASAFGKLYANYFLIIRGTKKLGEAIKSSMSYIEEYNYFNVTTGKIVENWSSEWQKYGYESADAYASSFSDRVTGLIGKMSGFKINNDGTTTEIANEGNLGLDLTELTNYSAGLMQVTNSLGLTGEASIATSKALTMLAGDMSSFRNIDLKTVMTNFQSGLIGQSRSLYKYGIDITNATLQTYAYNNGITKAVSEMTQAEKMQLRMLAILDQSKVAWGDLANTINSPSNQLRLLQNNFKSLARTIGNIFLPAVAKVLPYVNALVIAIRRLFTWVGNMLGADLSGVIGESSAGYSDAFENLIDDADDASDAIDGAASSAKKLKNELMGFDEINKFSDNTNSAGGSGAGGAIDLTDALNMALADYEKAWNEAFDNMENRANGLADKLVNAFKKAFSTGNFTEIGSTISTKLEGVLEGITWDSVYASAKKFGTGLATFLNGLITPELFGDVGTTIAGALNTKIYAALSFGENLDWNQIGEAVATGISNVFKTFDFEEFANTLNTWVDGIIEAIGSALINITWKDVFGAIGDFLGTLEFDTVSVLIAGFLIKNKLSIPGLLKSAIGTASIADITLSVGIVTLTAKTVRWMVNRDSYIEDAQSLSHWFFDLIFNDEDALKMNKYMDRYIEKYGRGIWGAIFGDFTIDEYTNEILDMGKRFALTFLSGLESIFGDTFLWKINFGDRSFIKELSELTNPTGKNKSTISGNSGGMSKSFGIKGELDLDQKQSQKNVNKAIEYMNRTGNIYPVNTSVTSDAEKDAENIRAGVSNEFGKLPPLNASVTSNSKTDARNIRAGISAELNLLPKLGIGVESTTPASAIRKPYADYFSTNNLKTGVEATTPFSTIYNKYADPFLKSPLKTALSLTNNGTMLYDKTQSEFGSKNLYAGVSIPSAGSLLNQFTNDWNNSRKTLSLDAKLRVSSVVTKGGMTMEMKAGGGIFVNGSWRPVTAYAGGGTPTSGEMFVARENGPELVGTIGNHTAVVNNGQIVASVASGVADAVADVMMAFMGRQRTEEPIVDVTVKADSETLYRTVQKGKQKADRRYHVVTEL